MLDFFLVFVMAHLSGDFVLQTNKIAKMKAAGIRGIVVHCGMILLVQGIFLSVYGVKGILLGVFCGLLHFLADCLKKIISCHLKGHTLYFFIDQALHIAIIGFLALLFSPYIPIVQLDIIYVKAAIGFILLAFVSNVIAKTFIRDMFQEYAGEDFFKKGERIFDALCCLCLFLILLLPPSLCTLLTVAGLWVYARLQQTGFGYPVKASGTKFFIYLLVAVSVVHFVLK